MTDRHQTSDTLLISLTSYFKRDGEDILLCFIDPDTEMTICTRLGDKTQRKIAVFMIDKEFNT